MDNFKQIITDEITKLAEKNFANKADVEAAVQASLDTKLQPLLTRLDDLEQAVVDVAKAAADDDMEAVKAAVEGVAPAGEGSGT